MPLSGGDPGSHRGPGAPFRGAGRRRRPEGSPLLGEPAASSRRAVVSSRGKRPPAAMGKVFVAVAESCGPLRQAGVGGPGGEEEEKEVKPRFPSDLSPGRPEGARSADRLRWVPLRLLARPLAPSASRWDYYSSPPLSRLFYNGGFDPSQSFFPPSLGVALPLPRRRGGRQGGRRPGTGSRGGCGGARSAAGGSRRGRPSPIKGRWAGTRERGSFFPPSPPSPALGIREGRWCGGRRAGEETEPGSPGAGRDRM